MNLESSNPRERAYFVFNQKHWYFEDSKTYNAFVRIRRDHFKQMGVIKVAEIDFYNVSVRFCVLSDTYIVPWIQKETQPECEGKLGGVWWRGHVYP